MNYKIVALVVAVAVSAFAFNPIGKNPIQDLENLKAFNNELRLVRNFLDDFIMGIINAILGSIADPMEIGHIPIEIKEPMLNIKGYIDDVKISGSSDFKMSYLKTNIILLTMDMGMSLPVLSVTGHYDIDGTAAVIIPIYGKGPFTINIYQIDATGQGKILVDRNGYISFGNIGYSIDLGDFRVRFEGMLGGGDLGDVLNEIINSFGLKIFNMIEPILHDFIVTAITEGINAQFENVTLADLIEGAFKPTTTTRAPEPMRLY